MHSVASFQVKNNGHTPVIIAMGPVPGGLPDPPVKLLPGKTSLPFTLAADYSIQSDIEPLPPAEVLVALTPGHLDAKAINAPSVKVDIIANFDLPKGDPFFPRT